MKKYTIDEITLRECMARGYCSPENENKVLDPELIEAMIKEIKECCDGDQFRGQCHASCG